MNVLLTIVTFSLLTAIQYPQDKTVEDFARRQEGFEIIVSTEADYFVHSIDKLQLHSKKREVAIRAKAPHSNQNSYNRSVYAKIQMWQFDFPSKETGDQAVDSLLKCFPNDCAKVQRQKAAGIKVTPSIWVLTGRTIYLARIACEQVDEKWVKFRQDFAESFAETDSEIIVTECGRLVWTTKEKIKELR